MIARICKTLWAAIHAMQPITAIVKVVMVMEVNVKMMMAPPSRTTHRMMLVFVKLSKYLAALMPVMEVRLRVWMLSALR